MQAKGGRLPTFEEQSLFNQEHPVSQPLANVGFANLHPVPPTLPVEARDGSQVPATDGGLWMWTSSILKPWDGYKESSLYPGYSVRLRTRCGSRSAQGSDQRPCRCTAV